MKNNRQTSFIILVSILVLSVFTVVTVYNLMPKNRESNSYYVKVGEEMSAKIEDFSIEHDKLTITTSGDAKEYCIKTTRSVPKNSSICWKKIENDTATISIYPYKKYYVWIKDMNGNMSIPLSINTKSRE